jgi:hypothetical protein
MVVIALMHTSSQWDPYASTEHRRMTGPCSAMTTMCVHSDDLDETM